MAVGCEVVLKPPEDAPPTLSLSAQLTRYAGLPAGAFNVLPGRGATTGSGLVDHPGIDHISFTGRPQTEHTVAVAATYSGPRR